jgi:hypothetical protein
MSCVSSVQQQNRREENHPRLPYAGHDAQLADRRENR